MPGILKKKRGSKSGNKVTFGKDVKDWDGLSAKNKSWFDFIDLVYNLYIEPEVAWERVPEKDKYHVLGMIMYVVNRFTTQKWAYSMPMGSRKKITMFTLNSECRTMQNLVYFMYDYYYERQLELIMKKQRERMIKFYKLEKYCNNRQNEDNENDENTEWDKIKNMFDVDQKQRKKLTVV
jgi:hypothetical protein